MANPSSYRRPALPLRPWITGKLCDDLSRATILHCDAYVFIYGGNKYLQIDWHVGGMTLIAQDTWLVEPDSITPVWDMHRSRGVLMYDGDKALHARVIQQAREAEQAGRWARVSVLCHYIDARERDAEAVLGTPLPTFQRRKRGPLVVKGNLPDIL